MTNYTGNGVSGPCFYIHTNEKGNYHSFEDQAAVMMCSGVKIWMNDGVVHRLDAPAITFPNGDELWIVNGLLHREDGPALVSNSELYYNSGRRVKDSKKIVKTVV